MCCQAPLCKRISLPWIPCTSRLKLLRLGLWNIFALLAKDHSVKDKVDGYGRFTHKRLIPSGILRHRPLHCYMDINDDFEDYHRRPTFPELFVTKLVVTQGTTRYQMKDMDIIFLLIPLSFWLGYYSLSKSSIFQNAQKCWKLGIFN